MSRPPSTRPEAVSPDGPVDPFRDLVEASGDGILVLDQEGIILYANPAAHPMLGRAEGDLLGQPFGLPAVTGEVAELQVIRPDGLVGWVELRLSSTRWQEKSAVVALLRDVTERQRYLAALAESEEKYRSVVERAGDGIIIIQDERVVFANPTMAATSGWPVDELVGLHIEELVTRTGDRRVLEFYRQRMAGEAPPATYETTIICKDETVVPVEVNAGLVTFDGRIADLVFVRDISARLRAEEAYKEKEEELRQSQKLEAVGRLAGGIAHDFNNMLGVIIGYTGVVIESLSEGDPLLEDLTQIKKAADRAASLTHQLLAFSRKQTLQPQVLDLNAELAGMSKMLQRLLGEDVQLTTRLCDTLWRVWADPGQVSQIIMNLAVNARDAMPQGGKLTIETANVTLDGHYASRHVAVQPGDYVVVAVTDTGCGMTRETLQNIFEPFFTTKKAGRGTGLGLSTVYGIVKQSGGSIWAYSEPGRGTAFKIYLPRSDASLEADRPPPEAPGTAKHAETILVVEDEKTIRRLIHRLLQRGGYKVLVASNGGEALLICERHDGPIDLMLTDVVMPEMGGRELAERLKPHRPEMKVLYMSGYTDDTMVRHGELPPGTPFLEKPFSGPGLARKVRAVLDDG